MNKFEISGYVGTEPKITVTQSGHKRASFTVGNKVKKDQTQFIYVQLWDKTAELAANYAHKGEFVIIEGRISVYESTDNTGAKRSQIQLVGDRLEVINTHRGQAQPSYQAPEPQYQAQPNYQAPQEPEINPEDIPF